jgi:hypothetical protein
VEKAASGRTDCSSCHTTSTLSLSGLSAGISGVGCASCHGDDPDHARRPHDPRFIVRRPAEAVCRQCHTPEQSPNFAYAAFIGKVACAAAPGASARH